MFVYPAQLTDIEVYKSALYKSVEGFINDAYSDFAKKDYEIEGYNTPEEATVAGLIEACRQMAIPVHIRLPLSNVGERNFIEKAGGYTVLTSTANYDSSRQLALKRALDFLGGLVGSLIALIVIAVALLGSVGK